MRSAGSIDKHQLIPTVTVLGYTSGMMREVPMSQPVSTGHGSRAAASAPTETALPLFP